MIFPLRRSSCEVNIHSMKLHKSTRAKGYSISIILKYSIYVDYALSNQWAGYL